MLLNICKQNMMSLSLLAGRTVKNYFLEPQNDHVLFVCVDVLSTSQQSFSHVGTIPVFLG